MKSKKLFLSVLALALVGTALTSCNGGKPASSVEEEVKTKAVSTGLGSVVGVDYDGESVKQVNVTTAAASFDEDGKVISVEFDVVQIPVVLDTEDETKVVLNATAKQVKDAGDKVIETKQELLERYGMKAISGIEKEVYEQMREFAAYVEGKTVAEVINHGYFERDANHTYVPDQEDGALKGKVTITVQDYVAALMEAYETRNAAVAVPEDATLNTGIGMTFSWDAAKAQVDAYVASITVSDDDVIYGAYVDTLQIPFEVVEGNIKLKASATQVKNAGPKVIESKKELGHRYGMYYIGTNGEFTLSPNASAEWFEQVEEIENWLIGQGVDALDFADAKFGSGHELASKVTIIVSGYFGVFTEAAAYAEELPQPTA